MYLFKQLFEGSLYCTLVVVLKLDTGRKILPWPGNSGLQEQDGSNLLITPTRIYNLGFWPCSMVRPFSQLCFVACMEVFFSPPPHPKPPTIWILRVVSTRKTIVVNQWRARWSRDGWLAAAKMAKVTF